MFKKLVENHVLANLLVILVLFAGAVSYLNLPREQDPEVNFNWAQIITSYPGAAAEDVEQEVTSPLEQAIRNVSDIKFVSSTSREGVSSILVRFTDIDDNTFERRVNDLRRELLNKYHAELPPTAREPALFEIKSSNAFPAAMLVLTGQADDEVLRKSAQQIKDDLQRVKGVDGVAALALTKPELHVEFDPDRLAAFHVPATLLGDSVAAYFHDTAAGAAGLGEQEWLVRLQGRSSDPGYLAKLPIVQPGSVTPLEAVATISRAHEKNDQLVRFNGKPAVLLQVNKKAGANTINLVEDLNHFIAERAPSLATLGLRLLLVDDQTSRIKESLEMMEQNALYGLMLMLVTTWLFLGWRLSLLNAFAIPFSVAGLFWVMAMSGMTLNTGVLVGILIALGMVVDGSVVVIDAIYYRLQHGAHIAKAALNGLHEVMVPVLVSVLTAIAAFLPLVLMPGILGKFMMVIPIVVTIALLVSLVDAFWLLPGHAITFNVNFKKPSKVHAVRLKASNWLINKYYKLLLGSLKRPVVSAAIAVLLFGGAFLLIYKEQVRLEFFADDPIRLFYVNVEMAPGTQLQETLRVVQRVEEAAKKHLKPEEVRAVVSYAGYQMTLKEPQMANSIGQVMVSLNQQTEDGRSVNAIIDSMRADIAATPGPYKRSFLTRSLGPPVSRPIEIKVRGDDYATLRQAASELESYLGTVGAIKNISDDDSPGKMELKLAVNTEAAQRTEVNPVAIGRLVRLNFDGEIVGQMQHQGEKLEVRVLAKKVALDDIDDALKQPVALPNGGHIVLGELLHAEKQQGKGNIRHYNFRRTITIEADLDKSRLDTLKANTLAKDKWQEIAPRYPGVSLDFTGELDDIKESLDALGTLMLVAVGVIYLILGAQFKSYVQPLIIFAALPLAFTGVVFGLYLTDNPLSLYTMYGMVALTGVIISTAIVLIDAANTRREAGSDPLKATIYASTRRLLPIVLTSTTTFVDLVPLAAGWGGKSLMWSPMATAIVYGLLVSTVLTLFVVPLLYFLIELAKPGIVPLKAQRLPDKVRI